MVIRMGIQRLSAKSIRRVARAIDVPTITRAWVNNGADHDIILWATWDHIHGWYDRKTGAWDYDPPDRQEHVSSCYGETPGSGLLLELEPFEDDGRWPTLND